MSKKIFEENINRFDGFSDIYNNSRPIPPQIITQIIMIYRKSPQMVLDIGSGTGLSTMIWKDISTKVIGIEPNDDMRNTAVSDSKANNVDYQKGFSNNTGLPSDSVDIITISQAFHWMDIQSTLEETYRILKADGVFAVYDCDWPPSIDWKVESEYNKLRAKCDHISYAKENPAVKNDKNSYIRVFNEFGKFRFVKEVVCHSVEKCTPERMIGIALSQGGIQDAMKIDKSILNDIDDFCNLVKSRCRGEFDIIFSYRLRMAVK